MGYGRCFGRVGALAVATRMAVSIGVAALVVVATVVPAPTVSPAVKLAATEMKPDSTALIMGGTSVPTPDNAYIDTVRNHFIAPTHPGQDINYVAVTAPMEAWPVTGFGRLVWLALGPQSVWGPGGPGWPDEPWWKLSGLFDLTFEQSVQAGVADLEAAMAAHGNDHLVIYGYSQGAMIAIREKRKLAEQYPAGSKAPDIDFVLSGDLNLPNGGLLARFPGLYIPIIDLSFNGAEPTDTPFDTAVITRQYDGVADFPLYPLNVISLLNAVLGAVYVHPYDLDVSLAPDPSKSPSYQGTHGDSSYYFFENPDLPLFAPLRSLGVPESLIDVVEPFLRVLVELGYDRTIPPWEPTPARLIPTLNPVTVAADLVNAIGEGFNNAAALISLPPPLSIPAPATADRDAAIAQVVSEPPAVTQDDLQAPQRKGREPVGTRDQINQTIGAVKSVIGDGRTILRSANADRDAAIAQVVSEPPAVTQDDLQAPQRKGREPVGTRDQINQTIGAVKSVIGDGRTILRSANGDNGSQPATAGPAWKPPARDAVNKAGSDLKKVVTKASDSIKKAPSGGKDDDDNGDMGQGGAR